MAETIGCKGCGAPFDPANNKNPDSPYCSMDCFNEDHSYECKRCGKKFFETSSQDFCWDCCKELGLADYAGLMKDYGDKDKVKANVDNITHGCKRCGKAFFEFAPQDLCFKCEQVYDAELDKITVRAGMKKKDDKADRILKDEGTFFQKIKEKIRMARKARMRTVQMLLCDSCDDVILNPEDGYIVHGNIYVADPDTMGGLIGNNFPEEGGTIDQVTKQVFCKKCFMRALETSPKPIGPIPRSSMDRGERDTIMSMEQQEIPF